jgi:hypothetical protein
MVPSYIKASQMAAVEFNQVEVQDYTREGVAKQIEEVRQESAAAMEVVLGVVAQLRKRVERLEAEKAK